MPPTPKFALLRTLGILDASRLFDILLARGLIFADKVIGGMAAKPVRELCQLLAEAVHRLLVHVGLCDKLGKRHYVLLGEKQATGPFEGIYQEDGRDALRHTCQ